MLNGKQSRNNDFFYIPDCSMKTTPGFAKGLKAKQNPIIKRGKSIGYFRGILSFSKDRLSEYNKINLPLKLDDAIKNFKNLKYTSLAPPTTSTSDTLSQRKDVTEPSIVKFPKKDSRLILKPTFYQLNEYYENGFTTDSFSKTTQNFNLLNKTSENTNDYSSFRKREKERKKTKRNLLKNYFYRPKKSASKKQRDFDTSITNDKYYSTATSFRKTLQSAKMPLLTKSFRKADTSDSISFLPEKNSQYQMPGSYQEVKEKLANEVVEVLEENKHKYTKTNNFQLIPKTITNYAYEIIKKIKIIKNFIQKQNEANFLTERTRYRKIYVVLNGLVVFTQDYIKGYYVEVPTRRFISFLQTKKDRLKEYYSFLSKCTKTFRSKVPFRNIFLLNGIPIFDLYDLPEEDKCVFVGVNNVFQGIHLFNEGLRTKQISNIDEKDLDLLNFKPVIKEPQHKFNFGDFIKKNKQNVKMKEARENREKMFKVIKKKVNYLNDQSFTDGYIKLEKEEFKYYSDNEEKRTRVRKFLNTMYPKRYQQLSYFNEVSLDNRIKYLFELRDKKVKKFNSQRIDETTKMGIEKLLKIYNTIRGRKLKINVDHETRNKNEKEMEKEKDKEIEDEIQHNALIMMKIFLEKLKIFQTYKKTKDDINLFSFYGNLRDLSAEPKTYVEKNKAVTRNIIQYSDWNIEKYYPDLISFNIPKILRTFPKLKRRQFYEIFVEFKTLLKICVTINKNTKLIKEGIDFETFYYCNHQMKSQGTELAKKIFRTINSLNSKYINWEEYMNGMLTLKNRDLNDKIDLFLKVIDTDSNGKLSFEEVYSISIESLSRSFDNKKKQENDYDEIVKILADYFARLIFQLVNMPITQEIPMDLIRQKICEGGKEASYLEMFICADNFT